MKKKDLKKKKLKKSFERFVSKHTDPNSPTKGIGIVIYKSTKKNENKLKLQKKKIFLKKSI